MSGSLLIPEEASARADRRLACLRLAVEVVRNLPPATAAKDAVRLAGEFAAFVDSDEPAPAPRDRADGLEPVR